MNLHAIGSAVSIASVPDGRCFAFRRRGQTYVAIKLTNGETVAILWPYHPNNPKLPSGLLQVSVIEHETLWLLNDAVLGPNAGADEMRLSTEITDEVGWLALGAGSLFVATYRGDHEVGWVDLSTGELHRNPPKPAVFFSGWSILTLGLDGEYEVFCTVERKATA